MKAKLEKRADGRTLSPSGRARRAAAAAMLGAQAMALAGCATIFSGQTQTVMLATAPEGESVLYNGARVEDGKSILVRKELRAPTLVIDDEKRHQVREMSYNPDPWLLGDAALLLFFVVPGVVAAGVDIATGAWRKLDERQVVFMPAGDAERAAPEKKPEAEAAPAGAPMLTHPIEP